MHKKLALLLLALLLPLVTHFSLQAHTAEVATKTHKIIIEYYCEKSLASIAYVNFETKTLAVYPPIFLCGGTLLDGRRLTVFLLQQLFAEYGGVTSGTYNLTLSGNLVLTARIRSLGDAKTIIGLIGVIDVSIVVGAFIAWAQRAKLEVL